MSQTEADRVWAHAKGPQARDDGAPLPLILNGVLDPESSVHGPNESVHLGVFEKAIARNVYMLEELGALARLDTE